MVNICHLLWVHFPILLPHPFRFSKDLRDDLLALPRDDCTYSGAENDAIISDLVVHYLVDEKFYNCNRFLQRMYLEEASPLFKGGLEGKKRGLKRRGHSGVNKNASSVRGQGTTDSVM